MKISIKKPLTDLSKALRYVLNIISLDPAGVGEVLTVGQVGVVGVEAVADTEDSGVFCLGGELVGEHVAFFLDNLELLCADEVLFSVFDAVDHQFDVEILAEAVGVDDGFDAYALAGGRV